MNYLLVESISKSYGIRELFSNITFGLHKGQRTALVARNGSGKTTLLNIIGGIDTPDSGKVVVRKDIRIGYLNQSPSFPPDKTVLEAILGGDQPINRILREYETLVNDPGTSPEALNHILQEMDRLNAWDYEARVKQMLHQLQLPDFHQKTSELSGGQIKRMALAAVLLSEPDLLILDEPTNHLDIAMTEWLEDYLFSPSMTLLMVTHDRYFLDNVCTDIIEIENNQVYNYQGNYAYYLEKKAERQATRESETDKARNLYLRELEWVRRMPKARGTKSKSRLDAFDDIKQKAFAYRKQKEIEINFRMKRMGSKILELVKVSKQYEEKVLMDKFTYSFRKGERIGIVGKNGTGKSTLLKMILGQTEPDAGKITTGETIEFGYYRQDGMIGNEDKRVIEVIREIADVIDTDRSGSLTASQMLQRFDFTPEMQYTYVSKLSGGEKRRLYLLTVLMKNPNFLILDEPTNDLDILTLNKLEEFLENFGGCMIIVSHDRYFMDKLVDQLFVFEGDGRITIYPGSYTEYRIHQEEEALRQQEVKEKMQVQQSVIVSEPKKEKTKLSYKEKLELEQLELQIPQWEAEKKQLEEKLNSGLTDHEELVRTSEQLNTLISLLDEKSMRWLELSELAG